MFHPGDLHSGISRAISEGKLVACFIGEDGNEESRVWEEEWLGPYGDLFATKAVILRIGLGTQEAAFLNAFCPVTTAPAFVVIHNGQVLAKLEAGMAKQDFVERASSALGLDASIMARQQDHEMSEVQRHQRTNEVADAADVRAPEQQTTAAEASRVTTPGIPTPDATDTVAAAPESSTAVDQPLAPSAQSQQETQEANVSSLFPDRAQRMEAEKARREAAERAERTARQNARRKEAEEAHATHKGKGREDDSLQKEKARRDWLVQQKQRKEEAKQERERILRQIEADRQDRKARARRPDEAPSEPLPPASDAASRRRMGAGGMCSLSIRLFDGSSIKGRFEPSATLSKTVRDWIKQETTDQASAHASDVPFTFKQILAPQPSRSIEVSEENQSLAEMGLAPNATLVLVPVSGYTEAYSAGGGTGYMGTALHAAYGVAGTAIGLVSSALSYIPGFGGAPSMPVDSTRAQDSEQDMPEGSASAGGIKVKTLADQRAETARKQSQQTEFYNGNSSAFQGRKDEDDQGNDTS